MPYSKKTYRFFILTVVLITLFCNNLIAQSSGCSTDPNVCRQIQVEITGVAFTGTDCLNGIPFENGSDHDLGLFISTPSINNDFFDFQWTNIVDLEAGDFTNMALPNPTGNYQCQSSNIFHLATLPGTNNTVDIDIVTYEANSANNQCNTSSSVAGTVIQSATNYSLDITQANGSFVIGGCLEYFYTITCGSLDANYLNNAYVTENTCEDAGGIFFEAPPGNWRFEYEVVGNGFFGTTTGNYFNANPYPEQTLILIPAGQSTPAQYEVTLVNLDFPAPGANSCAVNTRIVNTAGNLSTDCESCTANPDGCSEFQLILESINLYGNCGDRNLTTGLPDDNDLAFKLIVNGTTYNYEFEITNFDPTTDAEINIPINNLTNSCTGPMSFDLGDQNGNVFMPFNNLEFFEADDANCNYNSSVDDNYDLASQFLINLDNSGGTIGKVDNTTGLSLFDYEGSCFSVNYSIECTPIDIPIAQPTIAGCESDFVNFSLNTLNSIVSPSCVVLWYINPPSVFNDTPITTATLTSNTNLYVSVFCNNNSTCFESAQIDLSGIIGDPEPIQPPNNISLCAEANGCATANLEDLIPFITNNNSNLTTIWTNEFGADIPLANLDNYQYCSDTYVTVTVDNGFCTSTSSININLNLTANLPIATASDELCDTDGDGEECFNLNSLSNAVSLGSSNSLTWCTDPACNNIITNPSNFCTLTAIVYAQLSDNNGCNSNIVPITLNVLPFVDICTTSIETCDGDGNGTQTIDLTNYDNIVNCGTSNTVTWSVSNPTNYNASDGDMVTAQVFSADCESTIESYTISLTSGIVIYQDQSVFVDLCVPAGGMALNLNDYACEVAPSCPPLLWYTAADCNPSSLITDESNWNFTGSVTEVFAHIDNIDCPNPDVSTIFFAAVQYPTPPADCVIDICDYNQNGIVTLDLTSECNITNQGLILNWYDQNGVEIPDESIYTTGSTNQICATLTSLTNNCVSECANITINVNPLPVFNYNAITECSDNLTCFNLNSQNNLVTSDPTHLVAWFTDGGNLAAYPISCMDLTNYNAPLYVEVTDQNGCKSGNIVSVNEVNIDCLPSMPTTSFCKGGSDDTQEMLTANVTCNNIIDYEWSVLGGNANMLSISGNTEVLTVDISGANAGTYDIELCIEDDNGCTQCEEYPILVNDENPSNFIYPDFCEDATGLPSSILTPNGTFTVSGGITINSTTGAIASASEGSYNVTYETTGSECPSSFTTTVNVLASCDASWIPPASICSTEDHYDLIPSNCFDGVWSGPGVTQNGDGTAYFDATFSPIVNDNSFVICYTYLLPIDLCYDEECFLVDKEDVSEPQVSNHTFCDFDSPMICPTGVIGTVNYYSDQNGSILLGSGNPCFTLPSNVTQTVFVTQENANGCESESVPVSVTVEPCVSNCVSSTNCNNLSLTLESINTDGSCLGDNGGSSPPSPHITITDANGNELLNTHWIFDAAAGFTTEAVMNVGSNYTFGNCDANNSFAQCIAPNTNTLTFDVCINDLDDQNNCGASATSDNSSCQTQTVDLNNSEGTFEVGSCISFNYEISCQALETPTINPIANIAVCDSYELPTLTFTNNSDIIVSGYFDQPNGQGTEYLAGQTITQNTTLYAYAANCGGCFIDEEFEIEIFATPTVDVIPDINSCEDFVLPSFPITNLSEMCSSYTANYNNVLQPGDLTGTGTIILTVTNCGGCQSVSSFQVEVAGNVSAGDNTTYVDCADGSTLTLLSLLDGTPTPNGTWSSITGVISSGTIISDAANNGDYTYIVGSTACGDTSTLTLNLTDNPNAGTAGTPETVCSNITNFDLDILLSADVVPGSGTWNPSTFDPTIMDYIYEVGSGQCLDQETYSIVIDVSGNAGSDVAESFCGDESFLDLNTILSADADSPGTWNLPSSAPFNGLVQLVESNSNTYFYTVGTLPCQDTSYYDLTIDGNLSAGCDTSIALCEGTNIITLFDFLGCNPDIDGTWSGPNLPNEVWDFNTTVETGIYTYEIGNASCTAEASLTIAVVSDPQVGGDTIVELCSMEGTFLDLYDQLPSNTDPSGIWTDASGNIVPNSIEQIAINSGVYTYTLGTDPCQAAATLILTIYQSPEITIGPIAPYCDSYDLDSLIVTEDNGLMGSYVFENLADLIITSNQTVTVSWTETESGMACETSTDVVFDNFGLASNAGEDNEIFICNETAITFNLMDSLSGTPDLNGTWYFGPSILPAGNFTPGFSQCGDYLYIVEGVGDCLTDTAILTINCTEPISVSNLTEQCDANYENYTITFLIEGGDLSCIDVDEGAYPGGTLDVVSGTYTSAPIPNLSTYCFEISDCSACESVQFCNSFDCSCVTSVGEFTTTDASICLSNGINTATIIYNNTNEVLDPDDVRAFFVVTDINDPENTIVSQINGNVTSSLTNIDVLFDNNIYTTSTTYYLIAIVGTADGNGQPDFSDGCTNISNATSIIFYEEPTINILPLNDVCLDAGETINVVLEFTGTAPFNFDYTDGGFPNNGNTTIYNDYTITVSSPTTIQITAFNDFACNTTNLPIVQIFENEIDTNFQQICSGDTWTDLCGDDFSMNGTYTCVEMLPSGCTRTTVTFLEVVQQIDVVIDTSFCVGETIIIDGDVISIAGPYTYTDISVNGCDSITTINVTESDNNYATVDTLICEGDFIMLPDGMMVSDEDTYESIIVVPNSCDSVITTNVFYNIADTLPMVIDTINCTDTFYCFPDGTCITEAESGTYSDCDVVFDYEIFKDPCLFPVTLNLCPGEIYTTNCGNFVANEDTMFSCFDAITGTTDTFNVVVADTIFITQDFIYCEGDIHMACDGNAITNNTTIICEDNTNCLTIYTENIIFNPRYNINEFETVCQDLFFENDTIITDSLVTVNGCDSIIQTNYTVTPINQTSFNETICLGDSIEIYGNYYLTAGVYVFDDIVNPNNPDCFDIETYNVAVAGQEPDTVFASICPGECYNLPDGTCVTEGNYTTSIIWQPSGCEVITVYVVTLSTLDNAFFDYVSATFCNLNPNELPTNVATPGGIYSISPALPAGDFNSSTGQISFASTVPGEVYVITYTTPTGLCQADSNFTINIEDLIGSAFIYSTPICINEINQMPLQVENTGGIFTSNSTNIILDANTGEIDLTQMAANGFVNDEMVDVTYTIPGVCGSTTTYQIEILALDNATFSYLQNTYCPNSGFATINSSSVMTPNGVFTVSDINLNINPNTGELDLTNAVANTTYTVSYTVGNCNSVNQYQIFIENVPNPILDVRSSVCLGDSIIVELVNAAAYNNVTFNWSFNDAIILDGDGAGPYTLLYEDEGFYSVALTIEDAICEINPVIELVEVKTLHLVLSEDDTTFTAVPFSIHSAINAENDLVYSWTNGNTLNCDDCPNPIATPMATTTYMLEVTDTISGCSVSESLLLRVRNDLPYVPNVFTPNGDGNNDLFYPLGTRSVETLVFQVFNRWGEIMFRTYQTEQGWDGTFKDKNQNTEVYVWTVDYTFFDGTKHTDKGNVTLVR